MPAKKLAVPEPERNKDGDVIFYLQMVTTAPDGTQYKPYSSTFMSPLAIYVRVTVKAEYVLAFSPKQLILSPRGWFTVAKQMATASVAAAGAQ